MHKDKIIDYWLATSDKDFKTMENLFRSKDYHWALFMGHLVIEKLLKAYYVRNKEENYPFIHNLYKLADDADLPLNEEKKDFLDLVTTFNIRARYPDYKYKFYKKCTKEFTEINIQKIREFRTWLKKMINQ